MSTVTDDPPLDTTGYRYTLDLDCPPTTRHVPQIRHAITAWLSVCGLAGEAVDDLQLLVAELLTNAVTHAGAVTPVVHIALTVTPAAVRCEVADNSPTEPHRRTDADLDVHGRGLALVETVAQSWGFESDPVDETSGGLAGGTGGKRVWFVYPRSA